MLRPWVFLPAVLLLAWGGPLPPAAGHGILQGSSPQANAVLVSSPQTAVLAFNEPVDAVYSSASVRDQAGADHVRGVQVSADGRRMVVTLSSLSAGLYIVRWRVLSLVDGHTTTGSFAFSVGASAAAPPQPARTTAPLPIVAFRGIAFASALLLAGTILFELLVVRWSLARLAPEHGVIFREEIRPRLRALAAGSALALLGTAAVEFVLQAALLLDRPPGELIRSSVIWALLRDTRMGWSLLLRGTMALLILIPLSPAGRIIRFAAFVWVVVLTAVTIFLGGPAALSGSHVALIVLVGSVYALVAVLAAIIAPKVADLRIPEGRWVSVAAALVLLWGFTLASHASGRGAAAVLADWLHLAAASLWLGALPAVLIVFRSVPRADHAAVGRVLVPRISRLSAAGLGAMVITGLYSAWLHVPAFRAFVTTAYGTTLLVKLLLVAVVVALGAFNRFALRPRIERGIDHGGRALRGFRRSVAVEVTVAGAILLVVALLTITPPASVTSRRPEARITFAGIAGEYRIRLAVAPAEPGWNEFVAVVTQEPSAQAVLDATVRLTVESLQHDQQVSVEMSRERGGRYVASGDYLRQPGWWALSVRVVGGAPATFPLVLGAVPDTTEAGAVRVLDRARRRMQAVRTWREDEQITDGRGNVGVTRFEAVRPDRLRYRTGAGVEVVIVGATRYTRQPGGAWTTDRLPQPIRLRGPYAEFMEDPQAVRFGRSDLCAGEPCRVVLWRLPRASAAFAAWIGDRSGVVHRLLMVAPEHFMLSAPRDLDAPIAITPP